MRDPDRPRTRRHGMLAVGIALVAVATGCAARAEPAPPVASADRQAQVAERGQSVMPFDLDATTHHFTKTGSGGVQTVVADDPEDTSQVALIRQHLQQEADRFRRGDFTDPASIHGETMPGLAVLRDSPGKVTVEYATTGTGARITYTSNDTAVVAALHAWFDAQVGDHGAHATPGAPSAASPSPASR
jgi:hypothetical protein